MNMRTEHQGPAGQTPRGHLPGQPRLDAADARDLAMDQV